MASIPQTTIGEWLSLVEHLVRDQGVGGSNPLSPTNLNQLLRLTAETDSPRVPFGVSDFQLVPKTHPTYQSPTLIYAFTRTIH